VFAPEGAPVLAVDDGRVEFGETELSGKRATLFADDGTRYFYAHLSAVQGVDGKVRRGDLIGNVGHTGNASQTPSHLHFEIHDASGVINPFGPLEALRAGPSNPTEPSPPALPSEPTSPPERPANGLALLALLYLASRRG
jgi:murein DD-endopeptidase MepM/ murein hydrolase activator NlpD